MTDSRDITGKNRKITGTDGIKLPSGTTAQRNSSPTAGNIRFNSTINLAEFYTGTDWKAIDAPPIITTFTIDGGSNVTSGTIDASAGGNATIEVKGSLFDTTGANVTFVGSGETITTQSITRNSANLLTVTVARSDFDNANEAYGLKVTNGSGLFALLSDCITQDQAPSFDVAAGSLGSFTENVAVGATDIDASATDPDGDTITYSITVGSLPNGLTLNTSTGYITGTPTAPGTETFTIQASTSDASTTRQFSITITALPSGGSVSTSGNYRIHTFNSSGTFTNTISNLSVEYLIIAGGGGGGTGQHGNDCGGGGAGGYIAGGSHGNSGGGCSANSADTLSTGNYTIVVGGGGNGATGSNSNGS